MIKELDAKKQGIKVFRAAKHPTLKSATMITFTESNGNAADTPKTPARAGKAPMGSASPVKKRAAVGSVGATRQSGLALKPKGTAAATPATS